MFVRVFEQALPHLTQIDAIQRHSVKKGQQYLI